jgi:hypothetical protein
MRAELPCTISVIEAIKRESHRNVSKPLQHLTAKAVNDALFEAQAKGIPAIPDVDAIICPTRHKEVICRLLGEKVHQISHGVCCQVSGIRFMPATSSSVVGTNMTRHSTCGESGNGIALSDAELLRWNEESSDDALDLSYEEWEELRSCKRAAVLRALAL